MGIQDLWLFILAGVLLNITPGPDMALVIARSTQQGTRAGIVAALGIGCGALFHIAAATIGVSAIVLTSAYAFTLLKLVGGIYLVYLGVAMLKASVTEAPPAEAAQRLADTRLRGIFVQGVLTNSLNPKVAIFFLAFLPQFVEPDAPSKALALTTLGLVFTTVGTAWNVIVAWFAGRLARSPGYARLRAWLERAIGTLFVGVGIRLAFSERA